MNPKNLDDNLQLELFKKLIFDPESIESLFANEKLREGEDEFVQSYLSTDVNQFADSISFISMLKDQKEKEKYLLAVLPQIDGTKYHLLDFVFMQLQEKDMNSLNSLAYLSNEKINFHRLKASPV